MAEEPPSDKTQVIGPPAAAEPAASRLHQNALPVGAKLGEFEILDLVGEGGFGIVYLAQDHSLHRKVALKEYMPALLASRGRDASVAVRSERQRETFDIGLRSFVNEARMLASFDHPALIKVYRFWEANGTAYMVMPFLSGITLQDALKQRGEAPSEVWIRGLLSPLMEALAVLHDDKVYHRDIAPDNIMLLAGDRPMLLDFGAARRVISDMTHALTVILKPGYAPIEQYADMPGMKQGPWTDVYALAAVVYFMILKRKPPPAVGRLMEDNYEPLARSEAAGRYSARLLEGIDRCLRVRAEDRPQSMAAMREAIGLAPVAEATAGMPAFAPAAAMPAFSPASAAPAAVPVPTIDPTMVAAVREEGPTDVSVPDIALPDRTELVARTVDASPPPTWPPAPSSPMAPPGGVSEDEATTIVPAPVPLPLPLPLRPTPAVAAPDPPRPAPAVAAPEPRLDVDFAVDTAEPVADISLYADVESAPVPAGTSRAPLVAGGVVAVALLVAIAAYFSLKKPPPAPVAVVAAPTKAAAASAPAVVAPVPPPRLASLDAAIDAARAAADPALAPTLEVPPAAPLGGELSVAVKSAAGGALQVFVWDASTDRIHRLVPDDKGGAVPANGSATVTYRDKDTATRPPQTPLGRWRVVALLSDAPRDLSATAFARDGDAAVAERGTLEARLAGEGLAALVGQAQCAASAPCAGRFGIAIADVAQEAAPPVAAKRPAPGKAPSAQNPVKKNPDSEREYMKRLNKDLDTLLGK